LGRALGNVPVGAIIFIEESWLEPTFDAG